MVKLQGSNRGARPKESWKGSCGGATDQELQVSGGRTQPAPCSSRQVRRLTTSASLSTFPPSPLGLPIGGAQPEARRPCSPKRSAVEPTH